MLAETFPTPELDLWFLGTWLRIVATSEQTGGAMALMEQRAPLGFSPPRHVHHGEDTALFVLAGRLTVDVGDAVDELTPGGFAWLPRDVPHTFRVDSDEAHFLELIIPGGFERFHVDAGDRAEQERIPEPTEPDIGRLIGAIGPYGAEIVGPPMTLP